MQRSWITVYTVYVFDLLDFIRSNCSLKNLNKSTPYCGLVDVVMYVIM